MAPINPIIHLYTAILFVFVAFCKRSNNLTVIELYNQLRANVVNLRFDFQQLHQTCDVWITPGRLVNLIHSKIWSFHSMCWNSIKQCVWIEIFDWMKTFSILLYLLVALFLQDLVATSAISNTTSASRVLALTAALAWTASANSSASAPLVLLVLAVKLK